MTSYQYKVYKSNGKVKFRVEGDIEENPNLSDSKVMAYSRRQLGKNVPWLAPFLLEYGSYDYEFTVELFCCAIEANARALLEDEHHKHSKVRGRKALFAAAALRRAYCDVHPCDDKSYLNWVKRRGPCTERRHATKTGEYLGIQRVYNDIAGNQMGLEPEVYSDKMLDVIVKRQQRVEKQLKKDVWSYIIKHIETFWC